MTRLTVQLLGGFSVRLGSGQALPVGTKKAQALIAYLAVPPGRAHSRDKLASLLWGDTGDEQARQSLRQTLVALRRAMPATTPLVLLVDHDTLALNPAAVEVDVQAFERHAASDTVNGLEQAVGLYQGDLLEGVRIPEEPFEDWLRAERARLRERAVNTLTRLLALQSKAGETERAVHTAARLLTLDPLQEVVHRMLMRLYARQGRRGEALRQYQVCVSVLQRELRAEPETETKHLYRELLQQTAPRGAIPEASPVAPPRSQGAVVPEVPARESQLIGREVEIGRVRQAWAAATRGLGQVVVIVGEAGIGKSRLLAEVAAEAAQQGGRVFLGRCYESEQILPFGPWVDAFRTGRVIDNEELLKRLNPAWRAELSRLLPEVAVSGGPAATGDPLRLFESVVHVVEQLGQAQPTVLWLEDLHWADEMSLRLLAFVARRIRAAIVLIVATVREDEAGSGEVLRLTSEELGREPHCSSLTLSPLSRADTAALVQTFAGTEDDGGAAAARVEQIWAISEGNPFMAVEVVRAIEDGSMPHGSSTAPTLPVRIREVIIRRLERLSAQGQELAAVAAVIGREFGFALLQRATGVTEQEAAKGLEELVRRKILHGVGERFDFTHDRIREAIAIRLLAPRRPVIHRRIAESLEAIHAGHLGPHVLALGTHYRAAEVWDRAAHYLREAGHAAWRQFAKANAVACFEQSLDALGQLGNGETRREELFEAHFALARVIFSIGDFPRALVKYRIAENLARELGDNRRLCHVLGGLSYLLSSVGLHADAADAGEQALALARSLGDPSIEAWVSIGLGRICFATGRYRQGIERTRWVAEGSSLAALDAHAPAGALLPSVGSRTWLALCLARIGNYAEAIRMAEAAVRRADAGANPQGQVWAYYSLAQVHLERGEHALAIPLLERALPLCRNGEFPLYYPRVLGSLGSAHFLAGRTDEAMRLLEQALADCRTMHLVYGYAIILTHMGETCLWAGRVAEAGGLAEEAIAVVRERGERGDESWALHLTAEVRAHRTPPDLSGALAAYGEALDSALALEMRPLVAHCHLGLGKLYRRLDRGQEAREHFTTAAAMYRDMDMSFWLEQAETELRS